MSTSQPLPQTWSKHPLIRTTLASFLVLITIMAGHLFMTAINAVEYRVHADVLAQGVGVPANYHGEAPILETLERAASRVHSAENQAAFTDAISRLTAGQTVVIQTMPVTLTVILASFALITLGLLMLLATSRLAGDASQTLVGMFAGNFIWTGVEYGLIIASRNLGIYKSFHAVGGRIYGVFGEYVLLKHTWGLLVMVMIYFLFIESSRCPFFFFFRKRGPVMRKGIANGRIDNYGPRTAFELATIVWTFYLLLLWAYDESVFGVHSWFTYLVFFGSFSTTGYLMLTLYRKPSLGASIRYAIAVMVIFFNVFEIAAKWGFFTEPWIILTPINALVFFGGTAFGTYLVVKEIRRPKETALPAS